MKTQLANFIASLPWQEITNWIAAIGIPTLVGLWRKQAANHATSQAKLEAVVTGVEKVSTALGVNGRQVKQAIRDEAISAGVDVSLDNFVQKVTKTQDPVKQ